jgi:hypothetical protein
VARFDPASTAEGRELDPRAGDAVATIHVPTSAVFYEAAIEGLTRMNEEILAAADFPPLYQSGVGYRKEAEDTWRHADDVYCSGWGDCEDLASWRAAELRLSGEDPSARVYVYRSGPLRFHAVVARGNGRIEDPSVILGMRVSPARLAQLPKWEGDVEMSDTQPREFAVCRGSCSGCPNHQTQAGEDILSRGAVGDPGACLLGDRKPNVGFGFSSIVRAARSAASAPSSLARGAVRGFGRAYRLPGQVTTAISPGFGRTFATQPFAGQLFQNPAARFANTMGGGDEDGGGDDAGMGAIDEESGMDLAGIDEDDGQGTDVGQDEDEYGYGDYPDEYGGDYQYADGGASEEYPEDYPVEQAPPPAPESNPIENAMNAAGRGIKSAAQYGGGVLKDVVAPIGFGIQTAVAPIRTVAKVAEKTKKYLTMPFNALNKVFSFLGDGSDVVLPEQVGYVEDSDYVDGDEGIFEDGQAVDNGHLLGQNGEEIYDEEIPLSQKPRFHTFQDDETGAWHGQVVLPTKDAGKAFTLTSTPAADEKGAAERMYNLTKAAADSPAMMALMNPLAFTTLMLMKGTSKVPFGSIFSKVGGGIASAARAVGRGAESIAQTATEW